MACSIDDCDERRCSESRSESAANFEDRREIPLIPAGGRIQFSEVLPGTGSAVFHLMEQARLEGVVSKRKDSKYRSGSSTNWLKTKCYAIDQYELLVSSTNPGNQPLPSWPNSTRGVMLARLSSRSIARCVNGSGSVPKNAGPAPKGVKRPATQWVMPG